MPLRSVAKRRGGGPVSPLNELRLGEPGGGYRAVASEAAEAGLSCPSTSFGSASHAKDGAEAT